MTPNLLTNSESPWYVIIVKSRHEKKVAEDLNKIGVEVFCPLKKETRQWSDRKKIVEVPLFLNYIFVRITEAKRNEVFSVPGILRYLYWLGKPAIARASEIETIRNWLADENIIAIRLKELQPGKVIKIEKGPLKNKTAIIHQVRRNELKLVLNDMGLVVLAKIRDVA